ncbi:ATP-binding protein [Roseicitreum antarcticum]|nr:ATP-binding protein [Roseicitreum antarcticum]
MAIPGPVLLVGEDQRIMTANDAASETLGPNLAGQSVYAIIRQPDATRAFEAIRDANTSGTEARFIQTTPTGETIFRMVLRKLQPKSGARVTLATFVDISHIEEAEQMRRDFVANVSHELRSPLTVLGGFIETLQTAARDDVEARLRFLDIMAKEAQRMNRIVDDLLSLSNVEANEKVRPRDLIDLSDVIGSTIAALRPQIENNQIRLNYDPATSSHVIRGERDQLIQVFRNLIENAVKYGGSGGTVTIRTREHARMPGFSGPVVIVDVVDTGDGIDSVHLPRLTERFYRVDTHRSREKGGTGLGLAIVKHILNRHRARLSIQSSKGVGSTFSVQLPKDT